MRDNSPLCTSSIGRNDNSILPASYRPLDVAQHQRLRPKVIHRDIEEALDLASMQVHRNNMLAPRHRQHIRHQLRRNGCPRLVFLVHAGIREAGNDCRDPPRTSGLAGRDENEELHEVVVHVVAARLDNKDVLVADAL